MSGGQHVDARAGQRDRGLGRDPDVGGAAGVDHGDRTAAEHLEVVAVGEDRGVLVDAQAQLVRIQSDRAEQPVEPSTDVVRSEPQVVFTPPIDIFETDDGLVLLADLPGVSGDTLELQVQDNKLTLFGRVAAPAPENARLIHQEYRVADFLRSFILSDEVDHEQIEAKLNNGVLEVTLPRAAKAEPRRIQVRID